MSLVSVRSEEIKLPLDVVSSPDFQPNFLGLMEEEIIS